MIKWMGLFLIFGIPAAGTAQTFVVMKENVVSANPRMTIPAGACLELKEHDNSSFVLYFGNEIAVQPGSYKLTTLKSTIPGDSSEYFTLDADKKILTVNVAPIRDMAINSPIYLTDSNGIRKPNLKFVKARKTSYLIDTLSRLLRLTGDGIPDIFFTLPPPKSARNTGSTPGAEPKYADTPVTQGETKTKDGRSGGQTVLEDKSLWLWILGGLDVLVIIAGVILSMTGRLNIRFRGSLNKKEVPGPDKDKVLDAEEGRKEQQPLDAPKPPVRRKKPLPPEELAYQQEMSVHNILTRIDKLSQKLDQLQTTSGDQDRKQLEKLKESLKESEQAIAEKNAAVIRLGNLVAEKEIEAGYFSQLIHVGELKPIAAGLQGLFRVMKEQHQRALKFYTDKLATGADSRVTLYTSRFLSKYQAAIPATIDRWQSICDLLATTGLVADADLVKQLSKQHQEPAEAIRQFRGAIYKDLTTYVSATLILCEELKNLNRFLGEDYPDAMQAVAGFGSSSGGVTLIAERGADLHINYVPLFSDADVSNHITSVVNEKPSQLYPNPSTFRRDQIVQILEFGMKFKDEPGDTPRTKIVINK